MKDDIIAVGGCASPDGITFYSNYYKTFVYCKKPKDKLNFEYKVKVVEQLKPTETIDLALNKIPILRQIVTCLNNKMLLSAMIFLIFMDIIDFWIKSNFKSEESQMVMGLLLIIILLSSIVCIIAMCIVLKSIKWHGAEHKAINTYCNGKELTFENVKAASRVSKRCGTNLLIYLIVLNLSLKEIFYVVGLPQLNSVIFLLSISISIEIMDSKWLNQTIIYKTFEWIQDKIQYYITTKEPEDWQIKCAIVGIQSLIDNENGIS